MTVDHLGDVVAELARVPVLLVACDYDGTLSPIVDDPAQARPRRESVVALRSLASLPDTHVTVISGRSLRDLAALSRLPEEVHLVGSHGSEFDVGFALTLDPDQRRLRDRLSEAIEDVARATPGSRVEHKPASVAFHYREADAALAEQSVTALLSGVGAEPGVTVKRGKMVLELTVVPTHKGEALDRIRRMLSADAVFFVGDDVTDEDAFSVLAGPDIGVKVGPGDTLAGHRIDDTEDVARLLARICEARRAWLEGAGAVPIERHSLLSDQRTLALVTPDARISWLCHPRADSPAVFAELLGGPSAGHFTVRPEPNRAPLAQRYRDDALVLETRWAGVTVTDYLDVSGGRTAVPAGVTNLVRVIEGHGHVVIEFAPRLDFGRAHTRIEVTDDGLVVAGAAERLQLVAPPLPWEIVDDGVHQLARVAVELDGSPLVLDMELGIDGGGGPALDEPTRRRQTTDTWRQWLDGLRLPRHQPDLVKRSALVLKGLCHAPTGAILAAGTTSLPEVLGGVRNWDYRYCWPRDAALSAAALVELGSATEAVALLGWLQERLAHLPGPEQLRPVYPLVGDEYLPEAVIPTLHGYRGSRPVRIGNAAEHQVQLDVFGPCVDLVDRLVRRGHLLNDGWWWVVEQMAEAVGRRWHEPDHGLWEERRPPRHHVHSKIMCWQAIDRAISVADQARRPVPGAWVALRDEIAADVLERGWNPTIGAYTVAYGDDDADAAVLHLALSGLVPADDERFVATVEFIERELRDGPVVYRYVHDDGLPGREGAFLLCTTWLIETYVMMGHPDRAATLLERYADLAGPTGLLPEQYDPVTETALGNHPQAYSHLGLVNAALALDRVNSR